MPNPLKIPQFGFKPRTGLVDRYFVDPGSGIIDVNM